MYLLLILAYCHKNAILQRINVIENQAAGLMFTEIFKIVDKNLIST